MLFTKTKQPPKAPEGFDAIFICEEQSLLYGTFYVWAIVSKPPTRSNPDEFNQRAFGFLSHIPNIV